MTSAQRIALVVALVFLGASLGYIIGQRNAERSPASDSADVGFLHDMIAHHEQALTMSQHQIARGTEPRVTHFAREIVQSQSYEIGLMAGYLDRWDQPREHPTGASAMEWMGHSTLPTQMPGMATEEELLELTEAEGRDVDARFIELMKRHHEGGVEMAKAAAARADDEEVRALAKRIAAYQAIEIKEMEQAREALGLPEM